MIKYSSHTPTEDIELIIIGNAVKFNNLFFNISEIDFLLDKITTSEENLIVNKAKENSDEEWDKIDKTIHDNKILLIMNGKFLHQFKNDKNADVSRLALKQLEFLKIKNINWLSNAIEGDLKTFDKTSKKKTRQCLNILKNIETEMYENMQYYMEYCQKNDYITPQEWIENHKHF